MKINEEIKKLQLKKSLLVVMGTHHGIIYTLDSDEVTQVDELRIDTPVYSDNEGMSYHGSPGGAGEQSGHVLEPKKEKAQEDFSRDFAKKVSDISQKESIESIYLYAPLENKGLLESDWSNKMKGFIQDRFDGNFVSESPADLLAKIEKLHEGENKKEATGEAKELLEKTDHIQ
jgi:peptide subunit release factor 1 (eRF1)